LAGLLHSIHQILLFASDSSARAIIIITFQVPSAPIKLLAVYSIALASSQEEVSTSLLLGVVSRQNKI
jgi:hypothetical protein